MTIDNLIARLEEYRDDLGGDAEVRLMTQENWPFENGLVGLVSGAEINDNAHEGGDEEDVPTGDENVENDGILYLVEGQQHCYGSKRAWELAY